MAISVKIDDELESRILHIAGQKHRSADWIMSEAIRSYVDREEAKARFKQEAVDSLAAYTSNGRHLAAQEVQDWLIKWGTETETEIPPCHE